MHCCLIADAPEDPHVYSLIIDTEAGAHCRGKDLMPTKLMEFLTSEPGQEEDQKKEALLGKLKEINDYLVSKSCGTGV